MLTSTFNDLPMAVVLLDPKVRMPWVTPEQSITDDVNVQLAPKLSLAFAQMPPLAPVYPVEGLPLSKDHDRLSVLVAHPLGGPETAVEKSCCKGVLDPPPTANELTVIGMLFVAVAGEVQTSDEGVITAVTTSLFANPPSV